MRSLLRRTPRTATKRIFFATDLHGSEQCFRKFLNAGAVYDASFLIIGGDILGKRLVPIVENGAGRFSAQYAEHRYTDVEKDGVAAIKATIRAHGDYPIVTTREEAKEFADTEHMDAVFRKVAYDSVADWVTLAEERLRGSGRRCFVAPGNDDFLEIDSALQNSDVVEFAEDRCIRLDEDYEMITTGYSNPTPWDTERELPEDQVVGNRCVENQPRRVPVLVNHGGRSAAHLRNTRRAEQHERQRAQYRYCDKPRTRYAEVPRPP